MIVKIIINLFYIIKYKKYFIIF